MICSQVLSYEFKHNMQLDVILWSLWYYVVVDTQLGTML
jgi:hypothetical protein